MLEKQKINDPINIRKISHLIALTIFCLILQFFYYFLFRSSGYSFFIEFNNGNGLQAGTPVRMRGVHIGSIQSIRLKMNCVLAIAKIDSAEILIPNHSIIETTQTGLLNEPVVDIIPYEHLSFEDTKQYNPLSNLCDSSVIICDNIYVTGDRGLNYDDLIRSATRISQRFDDPRFFNIFYVFLHNGIEAADFFIDLIQVISGTASFDKISVHDFFI